MSIMIHHAHRIIPGNGSSVSPAVLITESDKVITVAHPDDPKIKSFMTSKEAKHIDHGSATLVPGFIDIHNHGALGHDFIASTQTDLCEIATYLASEGTTSFLSSTMAKPRIEEKAFLSQLGSLKIPGFGARWVGIHNEGPYLNLKFKAMMEAEGIRPFIKGEIDEDVDLTHSRLKMITVAPDIQDIEILIKEAHSHQIAVMFAHTDATAEQTLHALKAGGNGFTHLYNAMTPLTHRNPGAVTAALLQGDSYCELVTDGYHIDPLVVKLTHQIIGSKRLIVITDANPGKGMGDGEFEFGGKLCVCKDGKSYTKDTGRIAGSTIGMIDGFRNIMDYTGCSIEEAVQMCSVNPANLLNLDRIGSLVSGNFADFVVLDDHHGILSTYRDGSIVYDRNTEKKLYKILPVFKYRVWGGNRLKEKYGYVSDLPNIGECYNVIAMKGHIDCTVEATQELLSDFYETHSSLFQSHTEVMPVRIAMGNPIMPMSIQLHPNDEYAMKHEGRKGKPDGVYFIEGKGTMVLGHYAKTWEEFKAKVEAKDYEHLVRTIDVKAKEFVDVPFGTLHAFGGGLTLIEFTQNADLTYRLYDYDRIDPVLGTQRQLHVQQVLDNIRIPNSDTAPAQLHPIRENGLIRTMLHDEPGVYTAEKLEVETKAKFILDEFCFMTILEGQGTLNSMAIKAGETVFIPCAYGPIDIEGKMEMAYVSYKEKEIS